MRTVTVEEVKSPMIIALDFNCAGQERGGFVRAWAEGILELSRARGLDIDSPDYITLGLSLAACGGHATYRTVDDIPLVDVPCPCGDLNHWLIKYR